MPAWVQTGYQEYVKRLPRELVPHVQEIPMVHRGKSTATHVAIDQESQAILKVLPAKNRKVMLDLRGQSWTTQTLSDRLSFWMMDGRDLSFVIGGPDGFNQRCLSQADEKWCLSSLTLPHPLVRILFAEQLYRAWSILHNHPYHK